MYVTHHCGCGIPTTEHRDLSWGSSYLQISMSCMDIGQYYVNLIGSIDLVRPLTKFNYSILVSQESEGKNFIFLFAKRSECHVQLV